MDGEDVMDGGDVMDGAGDGMDDGVEVPAQPH